MPSVPSTSVPPSDRKQTAQFTLQSQDAEEGAVLALSGQLNVASVSELWTPAMTLLEKTNRKRVVVDASGLEYCDGAGIGLLFELRKRQLLMGGEMVILHLADSYQRVFDQFVPGEFRQERHQPKREHSAIEEAGRATLSFLEDAHELVSFLGELTSALWNTCRHPRRVRWSDTLLVIETAGANALPLVVLIGFIVGLVMAFQSAVILRSFGVEIYVADLIAKSMLRELGPLMTAIILAGRSGSAFAAELGTMQINEEINALKTMGLNPVRFLVVPRVLAATFITPLLTLASNLLGILGGAVVLILMGTPIVAYFNEVIKASDLIDVMGGLVKATVFGLLVAGIGCLRGLQTSSGASAVGASTTSAVVSGIVLIALSDAFFSVLYYYLGI
ncbi:MAG TPA: MlaE family lipid ABC transporter permease subunit [Candidatus Sumerlaeota bacterium]|nr:MlaE family lipid ABC transporter permease subunit [Candidatus Sumerlaeota bacterium]